MRAHRYTIPLAALLATLPLLISPTCGHDLLFHLTSWLEAATHFRHLLWPIWADTPAYNAGEPRFLFYPPISWTLGGLLGLLLPWPVIPGAFTWIALTLSGFSAHKLASRYAPPAPALLAAILYLANPYMLFTAYERTAYGELLAAAILPLLFLAAFANRPKITAIAVPIGLLWLTNAPAAIMGCYALAFLTVIRLVHVPGKQDSSRNHFTLTTLAATALGLTLAAAYLLPAVMERPFIQSDMALVEGMRIADNTLFHRMPGPTPDSLYHDQVVRTASTIALLLLAAIAAAYAAKRRTLSSPTHHPDSLPPSTIPACLLLAALIAILLTPWSAPLWTHIPELRFLQFPWRLMALLTPILTILAARALPTTPNRWLTPASLTLAAVLITPAWFVFHQPCEQKDTIASRVALFHSTLGTEPTDEYTPVTADGDSLYPNNPPFWLVLSSTASAKKDEAINDPPPTGRMPAGAPNYLQITPQNPVFLVLNRRQFPLWSITVNGKPSPPHTPIRDDGLIVLDLPAGPNTIEIRQLPLRSQAWGLLLTLLATAILLLLHRRPRQQSTP